MTITRMFTVYLNRTKQPPLSFNVNQYDRGEKWVFTILEENGTEYTPTTCSIVGRKSDGTGIAVEGTVENGKAVIYETEQMTAAPGKAVFELSVDNLTHGTANFIVNVEKKPIEDAVMSDSDLSLIEEALEMTTRIFTVTFESKYFDRWYTTCDKTYAEVKEVLDAGKPVIAYHRMIPTGYEEGQIPFTHYSEQLPFVRRHRPNSPQDGQGFYFFGVPTFGRVAQTTSQFDNNMVQSILCLRSNSTAEWILNYKELQTV